MTRTLYLGAYEVREVYEGLPGPNNLLEREERSSFGNGAQMRLANVGNSFAAGRKLEFSLKDHLGSTSAVHDESGEVQKSRGQQPTDERHSYDAWGARRDNASWAPAGPMLGHSPPPAPGDPPAEPKVASSQPRGYTGHEMLDDVGLVHMNGRLYDAALGRFCSADPIIQEGENSQNYNRYTYVLNNPLSHTDPSGYSWLSKGLRKAFMVVVYIVIVIITVIVYIYGGAQAAGQFFAAAVRFVNSPTGQALVAAGQSAVNSYYAGGSMSDLLRSAGRAAVKGYIAASAVQVATGAGKAVGSTLGQTAGYLTHVAAHGAVGGAMQEAYGGSFKDGFIASAAGAGLSYGIELGAASGGVTSQVWEAIGPVGKIAVESAAGGLASVVAGGKFAEGAYAAALTSIMMSTASRSAANIRNKDEAKSSIGGRLASSVKNASYGSSQVVRKAWNAPNTAVGLAWGTIGLLAEAAQLPFTSRWDYRPSLGNNALQFENHPLMSGAITLGNTIAYANEFGPDVWLPWENHVVGDHERQHTYQGEMLGVFYLPSNLVGLSLGQLSGDHHGSVNWNETGPQMNPPRPWP